MTPNSEVYAAPRDTAGFTSRSFFRIAIPSWRFVGIHIEPDHDEEVVSREELQALFQGELSGRDRRKVLTESEELERSRAGRIRRALYPQPVAN